MAATAFDTDYLVVGAGATAMAFVDTLLSETDARILLVDRHHRPGGHWNDAYPFVRLHQPSPWYGVASRELSNWAVDEAGLNRGQYSLASGAEVLAYFEQVLQQRFLPSGRVHWLPMCQVATDADSKHTVTSLTSGLVHAVTVHKKLVDATHARTAVPSTHRPRYAVAPGVTCVPLNDLPQISRPHASYTVIGSGKTGMDACVWLLENGVPPSIIRWVMPRDAWLLDRANFQPGIENFERSIGSAIGQFEAIAEAASVDDVFARLDQSGLLVRIDPAVEPTTYRCATVSQAELAQLRRIGDVVRMGHVRAIEPGRLVLDQGTMPADADTLYIDCSASAIQAPPDVPVFDRDRINLLMVRWCQPLFSAALIAYVESHVSDRAEMNALCTVVPNPERPADWLRMWAVTLANMGRWQQHPALSAWLRQCRLNSATAMMRSVQPDDEAKHRLLKLSAAKAGAAAMRLPQLLAGVA